MKKKLNKEIPKGKVVFSKRRILLSLFLFLIAAIIGVKLCGEAEKERKEEKRYEQIRRKKNSENKKLKKMYPDMVGWIEVKDSTFSYPVMQTKEVPEYYLNRNEKGDYSFYGTPFLDARCDMDSDQLIIYGDMKLVRTRVGGVKISTDLSAIERRVSLACKIAKWNMGGACTRNKNSK